MRGEEALPLGILAMQVVINTAVQPNIATLSWLAIVVVPHQ